MNAQLAQSLFNILEEESKNLISSPVKLPVHRRTIQRVKTAIQSHPNDPLSLKIMNTLSECERRLNKKETEVKVLSDAIGCIKKDVNKEHYPHVMNDLYSSLCERLERFGCKFNVTSKSCTTYVHFGISKIKFNFTIQNCREFDEYIITSVNNSEHPLSRIYKICNSRHVEIPPIPQRPFILEGLRALEPYPKSEAWTIAHFSDFIDLVDMDTVLSFINDLTNLNLKKSELLKRLKLTLKVTRNEANDREFSIQIEN
jgi:hypothetical protein